MASETDKSIITYMQGNLVCPSCGHVMKNVPKEAGGMACCCKWPFCKLLDKRFDLPTFRLSPTV